MDPTSPNYRPEFIPLGNVIRFLTTKPVPPILSAPLNDAEFESDQAVLLWWQIGLNGDTSRVQISMSSHFEWSVVDTTVAGRNFVIQQLPFGPYFWRVGYAGTRPFWSEAGRFAIRETVGVEDDESLVPEVLTLRVPYPNPTSSVAHFDLGLPESGSATLTAYDLLGRRVATIADQPMRRGWRSVTWQTAPLSNGVYVVRLRTGRASVSTKLVVLR